jgi:hypothetical protein
MFREQKEPSKTCWSVVANTLGALSPKKLFIFFLLGYAGATQQSIYLRGGQRAMLWNSKTCVESAPGCLLEVSGQHSGFTQYCGEEASNLENKSMIDQMKDERFIGHQLCESVVESRRIHKDGSLSQSEVDLSTPDTYVLRHRISVPSVDPEPAASESPKPSVCRLSVFRKDSEGFQPMKSNGVEADLGGYKCRVGLL